MNTFVHLGVEKMDLVTSVLLNRLLGAVGWERLKGFKCGKSMRYFIGDHF